MLLVFGFLLELEIQALILITALGRLHFSLILRHDAPPLPRREIPQSAPSCTDVPAERFRLSMLVLGLFGGHGLALALLPLLQPFGLNLVLRLRGLA